MQILLTRPHSEPTADRLRAAGHQVEILPLMAFEPVPWQAETPAAIMLTSPQAARVAGAAWQVPVYSVGAATAAAAWAAGFADVRDGGGTVQALVDRVAADGFSRILHLAGADRTPFKRPPGLQIDIAVVYAARLLPVTAIPDADLVLLYSARTAAHFAAECDRLGVVRRRLALAVLGNAVAQAAGTGWRDVIIASQPHEDALLAAIDSACQKTADSL